MTTCWDILELDSATADLSAVKRAYARLLKQNRPDRDPEGFRRLNQAFEEAKFELQLREKGITFHPEEGFRVPASQSGVAEISPVANPANNAADGIGIVADAAASTELESTRTVLSAALASGDSEKIRPAFSAWLQLLETNPDCIKSWAAATVALADRHGEQVFLGVTNSALLLELEYDQAVLTHRMLEKHLAECDTSFLTWLGEAILAKTDELDTSATTGVAVRVAAHLAMSNPALSRRLVDYCFPRMRGFAAQAINHVEFLQANASVMTGVFVGKAAQFVGNVLAVPNGPHDWHSEAGELALRQINAGAYRGWPGFAVLKEFSSDSRLTALIRRFEARPAAPVRATTSRHRNTSEGGGFGWWPFLLAFLVIKLLVLLGQSQSHSSSSALDRFDQSKHVDMDELWRNHVGPTPQPTPAIFIPRDPSLPPPSVSSDGDAFGLGFEGTWIPDTPMAVPDENGRIEIVTPVPTPDTRQP